MASPTSRRLAGRVEEAYVGFQHLEFKLLSVYARHTTHEINKYRHPVSQPGLYVDTA